MKKRIKKAGRMTKMKLPKLTFVKPEDVWKEYQSVAQASIHSGYTPEAIRLWIRKKRLPGWLYCNLIVIKRNAKLPPPPVSIPSLKRRAK